MVQLDIVINDVDYIILLMLKKLKMKYQNCYK